MTGVVAIEELRAAYLAVQQGRFRSGPHNAAPSAAPAAPAAGERWPDSSTRVLLVTGCMPSVGTSTVALALAGEAGDARVVECCTVAASGLCAATTAELGVVDGWVQGSRGEVLVERRSDRIPSLTQLPVPSETAREWSVLDSSWDLDVLLADPGWLGEVARTSPLVVLVTRASIPGMRRLDTALKLVGAERAHVVVVGVSRRRWPKPVEQSMSPAVRELKAQGRLIEVPLAASLAVDGITCEPLPAATVAAVADLFVSLKGELQ